MKKQFYLLLMMFLALAQHGWSQCSIEHSVEIMESAGQNIETHTMVFQWEASGFASLRYSLEGTSPVVLLTPFPSPDTITYEVPAYDIGDPHPFAGDTLFMNFSNDSCSAMEVHIFGTSSGGGTEVNDPRQIGQLIEGLGDGGVVRLSGDGNILAFSSANGMYVCELIGETWTPIGGEIILDTVASGGIEEIYLSTDGNSIWIQGAETIGCVYRNGGGFDVNQQLTGPNGLILDQIYDLSGDGNYVLASGFISDGLDFIEAYGCYNVFGQGELTEQISLAPFEQGYLSENGEYYCLSDEEFMTTIYNGSDASVVTTFSGIVLEASGDLSTCIIAPDGGGSGFISRWDGGTSFVSSPPFAISNIEAYGFSNTGNACVGLIDDGTVELSTFTEADGSLQIEQTSYIVEGLTNITAVNISGNGERLIFSNGSGGGNDVCVYRSELVEQIMEEPGGICDSTLTITAGIDAASTCPETEITITAAELLANDNASDGAELEIQELSLTNADDGSLVDNEDGTWTFTPAIGFIGDVALSYVVKKADNSLFFSETGHFYEFVPNEGIEWVDARDAAAASFSNGLQGYLATITSQAENDFITTKLQGTGWMGASDEAVEGEWKWVTGPEAGQQFWQGESDGSVVDGLYNNWEGRAAGDQFQPDNNNAGVVEDFGHFQPNGEWNDWPVLADVPFNVGLNGYVIEYGGLEDCPFDFIATGALTITVAQDESCTDTPDPEPNPETDCDLDGIPDDEDLDDDNDGILDINECTSATDYSQTEFGPSQITILTDHGQEIQVSVGSMVTDDALFGLGFPNSFNLDRGADNTNRFVIDFPWPVKSLEITAIDFDGDSFGDPTEWMENFSIFPTDIRGDSVRILTDGQQFGDTNPILVNGEGISQQTTNSSMVLVWEDLPNGTTSIAWDNRRTTMDLDINFQIDQICYDKDGDGIPNQKDLDTDGDGCFDAEEAGLIDLDGDGILGSSPVEVDASGMVVSAFGYTGWNPEVCIETEGCEPDPGLCEACPGDETAPVITCPEDVTITSTEFEVLTNVEESIFGGFESEYREADISLGDQAITEEGTWVVTSDPSLYHFLFNDCDDADGNPDGNMLVFNGAPEIGVAVYCQEVVLVEGTAYDMSVMVASVLEGSPAMIQFAIDDAPQGEIHTATFDICQWTELSTSYTASASGPVRICILNQNNAAGGNDFALDNFAITAEDGTAVSIGTLGEATATDDCGPVTPTFEDSEVVDTCETIITRTWTAVDSCGNVSSCVQTITVTNDDNEICNPDPCEDCSDTTPPVIEGVEVSITGECGEISIEELGITASDNCGEPVTITFTEFQFSPSCLGSLQRTYTATDNCGNTSTAIQIIDLTNENGPIMECLEDASYQCISDVPEAVEPVVTHGCGLEIVSLRLNETNEGTECNRTITREWTAIDACGGISTCIQVITVADTELPVAPEAPAPITVQCNDVPNADILLATDNCSDPITGVSTDERTDGECPNNYIITRTWTFTDDCDNVSSISQTITVEDTEAPVAPEAPAPVTVQCADDVPAVAELTATDNCSGTITGVPTEDEVTPGDCPNSFVVTRTWIFTDECGNSSSVSQTITVEDTEAPVAPEAPAPVAVQCADDVPAAAELTATDNCSGTITGVPSGDVVTPGDCPNSFVVTRTWVFTDECGNSSSVSQTITVEDTEAPIAPEAPAPVAVQCADDVPAAAELTATDNCSGVITGVPSGDVVTPGDCPNSFVVTRTWIFTDECGNSSSVSQTITVEDTEAPVPPLAPAPVAVQCADDVPAADELFAADNCDGFVTGVPAEDEVTPGDCPNSFVVTRTWVFTDECGNSSSVSQTITVEDTEAPIAPEAPAPVAVQCADDVPAAAELTATDNCSGTITGVPTEDEVTPGDCPNSFVVTRTWIFTDECGNSSSVSQTITVEDTEAPVAPEAPAPVAVQCADDVPAAAELTATDNCSGTITGVPTGDVVTPGDCPNSFVVTRTWIFTDECGNSSSVSQTITVEDTEAPVAPEAPAPVAVQCADDVPAAAELTAIDNCSGTITGVPTGDEVTPGDCPNSFVVTRTWIFTDECGNSSSVSQTITVEDTEAPVAPEAPAPVAVQCADDVPAAAELTAIDNCSGTITGVPTGDEVTPGDCPNSFVVTRTWIFTDECGNSSSVSQTITVEDTEAPVAPEAPAPVAVQCADDVPVPAELTAIDNCSGTITGVPTEDAVTPGDCPNSFVVTRTWTFTDECGNSSSVSQTITVEDTEAPVAPEAPAPVAVQCADDVPAATELTATDNCSGTITGVPTDEVTPGDCPNSFVVTRTWRFTDECGNSSSISQTITVEDTEAPILSNPPTDVTIECGEEIPTYSPEWSDNCGNISLSATSGVGVGECSETQFFTYTATDECGNTTSASWTITIEDTTAPAAPEAPAPVAVQCADDVPAAAVLTATDICDGAIAGVPSDEVTPGDCPNSFVVTRTWTFADRCGNSSSVSQTITVEDTEAPVLSNPPTDVTIECGEEIPTYSPQWTDNCGTISEGASGGLGMGECSEIQFFTYTATDECGNTTSASWTITIEDTTAPAAPEAPAPVAVQCADDVPAPVELTATDICDGPITNVPSDEVTSGDCPNSFVVTRTWTFADRCGNSSSVSQIITVEDTEAPVAPEAPAPVAVQCADDVPAAVELTAIDNCSGTITGVPAEDEVTPGDCPNSFVVTRTWIFTDECGNSSSVSQTITVEDTEAPVAPEVVPEPVVVQCADDVPAAIQITTQDNCSGTITGVPTSEEVTPGDCPNSFVVTRVYTFTDECGNSSAISHTITVEDTEAPIFNSEPEDLTVECIDEVADLPTPEATDNCQVPDVVCVESEDLDECGNGLITITCTATDSCGNATVLSYTITVSDITAPELVGVPADLVLDCDAELPEVPEVTAIDNCDDEVTITYLETVNDSLPVDCILSQPSEPLCHDTENWSMVMFNLPSTKFYSNVESNFVEFPDGTAHLTGNVSDNTNPDGGFLIDVWFENGMNWQEWSSQSFPTSFKDECGTGMHEDWTYYIVTPGLATMTGYGNLAGSQFNLIHAPVNKLFAYQVGVGANNVNSSFGNGGWFIAEGNLVVDGEVFSDLMVAGDFAFDGDCCPSVEVERTWTATDCSGNTTQATQTITFERLDDNDDGEMINTFEPIKGFTPTSGLLESTGKDITISNIMPNPATEYALFNYVLNKPAHVVIDIVDMNGNLAQKIFEGNASAGVSNVHQIRTKDMTSGVYFVRVSSEKEMTFKKLVIVN